MAQNLQSGVSFGAHAIPGRWDMEGTAHAAGEVLRWWRDTYGSRRFGRHRNWTNPYDLITLEAAKALSGRMDLFSSRSLTLANPYFTITLAAEC